MFRIFKKFQTEEDGALTVDWVIISALVIGLGLSAVTAVKGGTEAPVASASQYMTKLAEE